MKNLIIYIVAGVLGIALVGGVAFAAAKLAIGTSGATAQHVTAADGSPKVEITKENTLALKPFTTNLGDQGRNSYINVTFELVLTDDKAKEKVDPQVPAIRDAVVGILHSKKSMEVTGAEGANKLKAEVMDRVNEVIGGKLVQQVLITDIVVQP
ncbi:MAG TPA: flagellar basal body-associated FliL family protein [Symbiobacteriaceae bacterium]|jgi:flagellar FliL protein|nr:flagellar basal body-associated FliL family protein [Symbiobacteriaceae bacterium]